MFASFLLCCYFGVGGNIWNMLHLWHMLNIINIGIDYMCEINGVLDKY